MKKIFLSATLLLSLFTFAQTTYPGNGKTGFGGPIGLGSLTISETPTTLVFTLTKGTNNLNDILVFYADVRSGGITSTSGLTLMGNKYESAVSSKSGANSSTLTFPAGFQPDGAIAFDKDGGKSYAFIGGMMIEGAAPTATPTGTASSATYTQVVNKSDLGLVAGNVTFTFVGTYISGTAYRSNESISDPMTGFIEGWNPFTISTVNTYTTTTLPVKMLDFKAVKEKEKVQLKWTVADETNIEEYQVQRSSNGVQFSTINTVKGKNAAGTLKYDFTDNTATSGVNYYRLVIVERGKTAYSKIVSIKNSIDKNSFTVTPRGRSLSIKLSGIDAGTYRISVMNTSGQVLHSLSFQHDGSDIIKDVDVNNALIKGVYRVTMQGDNAQYIKSILIN